MTAIAFTSLMMSILASCIVVSYQEYAAVRGWPVGRLFMGSGWLKGLAGLNALFAVAYTWMIYSFPWALGVFVAGWVASFVVILVLRKHAQVASLLIFLVSWILQFFY